MSFTYVPSELADNSLYQVRFNTGQTNENSSVRIEDEEIQFLLEANYHDVKQVSIEVLNSLIMKASYLVTSTTGEVSSEYSDLLENLKKARDDMEDSLSRIEIDSEVLGFTGILNDDMEKIRKDEEVYKDGNVIDPKRPYYRTVESNIGRSNLNYEDE